MADRLRLRQRMESPPRNSEDHETELQRALQNIADEWHRPERARSSVSDNQSQIGYLKRAVYQLVRAWLRRDDPLPLDACLTQAGVRRSNLNELRGSYFYRVLSALRRYRVPTDNMMISIAYELEYARRHDVPPEFLVGFLLQSTLRKSAGSKVRSGALEPDIPVTEWRKANPVPRLGAYKKRSRTQSF